LATSSNTSFQAALQALVDVVQAVGQREGQLLGRRRAGLANVIAADRHGVPLRHVPRAELDHVDRQAHRRLGRKIDLVLGVEFLERVVLDRASQLAPIDAAIGGVGQVKGHHDHGRCVDGHRHRQPADVDPVEELAHIIDRVERDAQPAHFSVRPRVIAVQTHQGRQVERRAQAGLAALDEEFEPLVGLPRRAKAGKLPHRPQPAAIHRGVDAPRVGILAGETERGLVVEVLQAVGRVKRLDRRAADGRGGLHRRRRGFDLFLPLGPKLAIDGGCHGSEFLARNRDESDDGICEVACALAEPGGNCATRPKKRTNTIV
jgi:hypothetical protein